MKRAIVVFLVISALIIVLIFQYRWLISWAERDISELYRGINFRIFRAISNQMERSLPLLEDRALNENSSLDYIKSKIEEIDTPYIESIGFTFNDKFYRFEDGEWWSSKHHEPDLNGEKLLKLSLPIPRSETIRLILEMDFLSFVNSEILNNDFSDGYDFKWFYELPENGVILNEKEYSFSPINTLSQRIFNRNREWYFGINRASLFRPKPFSDKDKPSIYYSIYVDGKPLVYQKENYYLFQWGLTIILLLGLGGAYILILNQIGRLKKLRKQEKIFVASVSHELRTPLTVIHSAADNIERGIVSKERVLKYGSLIKEQSNRLKDMVEDILLFSRLEGKSERAPILGEVTKDFLMDNLESLKESIETIYNREVKLELSINEPFLSDGESILHILSNLITNSAIHGDGVIRVKGHMRIPKKYVFSVEDRGTGVPKREIKSIFKPFYRGTKSYDDQKKGSGLGLFIAYRKSKLLKGELTVDTTYKRGLKVDLTIPFIPSLEDIHE